MHTHEHEMTLVIGGTGKTGRRVVERLRDRGRPVRSASRSSDPPFDWEDRTTWGPALRGASAAYVSFYPDLAVPGAPEAIAALADEALEREDEPWEALVGFIERGSEFQAENRAMRELLLG
ncbi:MAG: SDR family oxidoreductase, partial [Solirubrobacteraceae bacterium]